MSESVEFFATTPKGMEEPLAAELRSLGAADVKAVKAGASFSGSLRTAYKACLWSRLASRILMPLKTFKAPNPQDLYDGVRSIRWSDYFDSKNTMAVDFSSSASVISHTQFGAQKVKDAVVDGFRARSGDRPSVDLRNPDIRINVYVNRDVATVSLDVSGESLHRRGYREEAARAPLKENLAAAILILADWMSLSKKGASFIDPMCGSGTLAIEAALIATNTAPGTFRSNYSFLHWKQHDQLLWADLISEANDLRVRDTKKVSKIMASDVDAGAIRTTLINLNKAGLGELVTTERKDFKDIVQIESQTDDPRGIVVVNPPYGQRIGEIESLKNLYRTIGDVFKQRFKGWEGYVFTGNLELSKQIGLRSSRKTVLFNGAIECRLLKFLLY